MPTGFSVSAAEEIGALFLQGAAAPTYPASWYFALYTTALALDGTGGVEVADSAYTRLPLTRSSANFPKVAQATWSPAGALTFGFSATSTFTVVQVALRDAATGGTVKFVGGMDRPVTFVSGDRVRFPDGTVNFQTAGLFASGWTVSAAEGVGNWFFQGAAAPTYPASWSLALMSTPYTRDGTGGIEALGNAYARASVTRSSANFPKVNAGTWRNASAINFPTSTGPYQVAQVALMDAASGGNPIALADLVPAASLINGSPVLFSANTLTFQFFLGASTLISWDASGDPLTVGYRVHVGTSTGSYPVTVDVGNVLSTTVSTVATGTTYFFIVTDYNASGGESVASNEISKAL